MDEKILKRIELVRPVWGGRVEIKTGFQGGVSNELLLVNIPTISIYPKLFVLDLDIWDITNQQRPQSLYNAGFEVFFGTSGDPRVVKLGIGVHSVIGDSLKVRVIPPKTFMFQPHWEFRAHATIVDSGMPSYVEV